MAPTARRYRRWCGAILAEGLPRVSGIGLPHDGYDDPAHLIGCRSYDGLSSPCVVEFTYARLEEMPQEELPEHCLIPAELIRAGFPPDGPRLARLVHHEMFCGMLTNHSRPRRRQPVR